VRIDDAVGWAASHLLGAAVSGKPAEDQIGPAALFPHRRPQVAQRALEPSICTSNANKRSLRGAWPYGNKTRTVTIQNA
jgi:hypothetical protein